MKGDCFVLATAHLFGVSVESLKKYMPGPDYHEQEFIRYVVEVHKKRVTPVERLLAYCRLENGKLQPPTKIVENPLWLPRPSFGLVWGAGRSVGHWCTLVNVETLWTWDPRTMNRQDGFPPDFTPVRFWWVS